MPLTLFDKIWNFHCVTARGDGKDILYIDRHVMHELHAPHAFKELELSARTIRRPDLTMSVLDHTVATKPLAVLGSAQIKGTKAGGLKYGFRVIDVTEKVHGIGHVVTPELGVALPGLTLACPDSHASTVGALGCLAFGCGTSEMGHVLATQTIAMKKPKQMRVVLNGCLSKGVGAKDLALSLIRTLGVDAGRGFAIEYTGEVISNMSLEARMTLCNMTIEWGGRTCLIAPDEKVISYCKGRSGAPKGTQWDQAVNYWKTLFSDQDCAFDRQVQIDCTEISPQISWGTDPSQVIGIDELVPSEDDDNANSTEKLRGALKYMGLHSGQAIAGQVVQRVFIGSCSNSRLSDLSEAANLVRGRKVAQGVTAIIVPGSNSVKLEAEKLGFDLIFKEAGFEWRNSGCSMCAGANEDVWSPGDRVISTTNRNFENRQGVGVRTHLSSAVMAAAAAISGKIVDVRELFNEGTEK
jgi:3-isopropylmalate/(R)-2-methylmalate dehydratase large subunit